MSFLWTRCIIFPFLIRIQRNKHFLVTSFRMQTAQIRELQSALTFYMPMQSSPSLHDQIWRSVTKEFWYSRAATTKRYRVSEESVWFSSKPQFRITYEWYVHERESIYDLQKCGFIHLGPKLLYKLPTWLDAHTWYRIIGNFWMSSSDLYVSWISSRLTAKVDRNADMRVKWRLACMQLNYSLWVSPGHK